jgi:RNA polymerase sigma-B factor
MRCVPRTHERDETELDRLTRYHATRCPRLKAELVEEYFWIAHAVARRYRGRGEPYEDILQVAALGIVAALDRFDPETGRAFPAFAMPTALGEVKRHFRDRSWRVRVPRGVKDLVLEVSRTVDELTADLDREPTTREVADRLGVEVVAVERTRVASEANHPAPVDPMYDSGRDQLADPGPGGEELADDRVMLDLGLEQLAERERTIVLLRFYEDLSQEEIAARMGISQPHVSRILRAALAEMRRALTTVP